MPSSSVVVVSTVPWELINTTTTFTSALLLESFTKPLTVNVAGVSTGFVSGLGVVVGVVAGTGVGVGAATGSGVGVGDGWDSSFT